MRNQNTTETGQPLVIVHLTIAFKTHFVSRTIPSRPWAPYMSISVCSKESTTYGAVSCRWGVGPPYCKFIGIKCSKPSNTPSGTPLNHLAPHHCMHYEKMYGGRGVYLWKTGWLILYYLLVSSLLLSFGPCCRLVLFFSLASWLLALIFFLFLALDFLFWFLALFALADFLFLLFLLLPLDFLIWFLALAVGFLLAVPVSSSQLCSCVTFSSASCSCLLVFCCGVLISQLDFC